MVEENKNKGKIIAVAGNHSTTADLMSVLLREGYKISYLINLPPEKNSGVAGYVNLESFAKKHGINLIRPLTYEMKDIETRRLIEMYPIDLLIVIGWQRLIPEWLLKHLIIGAFGTHGSSQPLPKGRGHSLLNWILIEDKKLFINNLFRYDARADSGDIVKAQEFDIFPWDTIATLHHKSQVAQTQLLLKNLPEILAGTAIYKKQSTDVMPSYYPKRTPEDGVLNWCWSSLDLYNLIRAVTKPYPGAFTWQNEKCIYIWRAMPFDTKIDYPGEPAGKILEVFDDGMFVVKTGDGALLVTDYETQEPNQTWRPEYGMIFTSRFNASFEKLKTIKPIRQDDLDIKFTKEGYAKLLKLAQESGYIIYPMKQALTIQQNNITPITILRHDVDLSLALALEMAKYEASIGLKSTYFILLYNNFYNPLSPAGRAIIKQIADLGHEIGLHYDTSIYDEKNIGNFLSRDLEILSSIVGQKIVSASQHIPTDNPLFDISQYIENEAYSEKIMQQFAYVSDSSMKWRAVTPMDLIAMKKSFQFLAHPLWWFARGDDLAEKMGFVNELSASHHGAHCDDFVNYALKCLAKRDQLDDQYKKRKKLLNDTKIKK